MIPFARVLNYGNKAPEPAGLRDIKVSNGGTVYAIDGNYTFYTIGVNIYGELGLGHKNTITTPIWNPVLTNIERVYAGNGGAFAISRDSKVYYCGYGYGIGLGNDLTTFTDITNTTFSTVSVVNIKEIHSMGGNTIVLMNDNTIWGCGRNNSYQLGLGNSAEITKLTYITDNVDTLKLDSESTIISKLDGSQYYCGQYNYGVEGSAITSYGYRTTPLLKFSNPVGSTFFSSSVVYGWMYLNKNTNTSYSRGWNIFGELGTGNTVNSSTFVTRSWGSDTISPLINPLTNKSSYTQLILTSSGIWGVGYNASGILGDGSTTGRPTWVKATNLPFDVSDIKMCAYGTGVGVVYTTSGELYYIGANNTFYGGTLTYATTYTKTFLP